ncbi:MULTISPECIES: dihydrofolate reductase family protein [unclassified Pseudoclavibacter]|uniref:dihydrofolate reductase family protein n=1 Tax=unclassified Pseudoclavibacter TaxID=2615177 RepID=UPI001300DB61|nr:MULTISPECIES: dihydrofolate reductase family protein [unclassified Pseudoclavibacter]KAB1645743.1 pyrimidine reductase family protein [Pseudoclavibacter sp. CFCC 14310]KAB1664349.1 pyrimidine reductase family protein [Pseudoclavibacter sp. CFCC 13611]
MSEITELITTSDAATSLSDDDLLRRYAWPAGDGVRIRLNFVSSLDGAVTVGGVSGPLGGEADHRVFDLLRRRAHVVLLGAGTARDEGYGAMRVDDASAAWREAHGLSRHPAFALVSGRAALDPGSDVFVNAPTRPIVFTLASADADRRAALAEVAEVVVVGETEIDMTRLVAALHARGLCDVLCEGGPHLASALFDADAVTELCLSLDALVVGGDGPRLTHGVAEFSRRFRLCDALRSDDLLLLRYRRARD